MAAPFYSKADQDIYAGGQHFIPQERFRLGPYTPPAIMGQNTNAGIVNTSAAGSYMGYPSYEAWLLAQGGGGGGGDGPDQIEEDTFSMGMSPGALGGKLSGFGNWAKRTAGDLGHLYSQLPTPGNLIMKGIRHWQTKRAEKEAAEQQAKVDLVSQQSQANAAAAGGGGPQSGITASTTAAQAAGMGGGSRQATSAGSTKSDRDDGGWGWAQGGRIGLRPGGIVNADKQYYGKEDWEIQQINKYGVSYPEFLQNQFGKGLHEMDIGEIATAVKAWDSWRSSQAEGGRIGYRTAGPVLGEDEGSENIFEFMQDQGIPSGDMVSNEWNDRLLEQLYDKFIDQGFSPADAEKMALQEFELMSQGPEQDQGIASLV